MLQLAAFAAVFMGWQIFQDGPLAYYMACGLLIALLCIQRARALGGVAWAIYGYGASMGIMSATCGGLYAAKADGYSMLCDKGTGLPISLISGGALLLVAAYVYKKGRDKNG